MVKVPLKPKKKMDTAGGGGGGGRWGGGGGGGGGGCFGERKWLRERIRCSRERNA